MAPREVAERRPCDLRSGADRLAQWELSRIEHWSLRVPCSARVPACEAGACDFCDSTSPPLGSSVLPGAAGSTVSTQCVTGLCLSFLLFCVVHRVLLSCQCFRVTVLHPAGSRCWGRNAGSPGGPGFPRGGVTCRLSPLSRAVQCPAVTLTAPTTTAGPGH